MRTEPRSPTRAILQDEAQDPTRRAELLLPLVYDQLRAAAVLGPHHVEVLRRENDLALPLLEDALTLSEARLGKEHPRTLSVMGNSASLFSAVVRRRPCR